jgi:hypothetical protein
MPENLEVPKSLLVRVDRQGTYARIPQLKEEPHWSYTVDPKIAI